MICGACGMVRPGPTPASGLCAGCRDKDVCDATRLDAAERAERLTIYRMLMDPTDDMDTMYDMGTRPWAGWKAEPCILGMGEYQRVFRCNRCGVDVGSVDGYRAHLLAVHPQVLALFEAEALPRCTMRWKRAVKMVFLLVLRSAGFGWEALSAWRRGPRRRATA